MAYLFFDDKFIKEEPKLYKKILDHVGAVKIENVWNLGIKKITFHHNKIGKDEAAIIYIHRDLEYFRLGTIERANPTRMTGIRRYRLKMDDMLDKCPPTHWSKRDA